MFLKCVTLTGFKSFATKTTLELEPGLTAIVGPNGSGKSNLADAIRWTLGEQNKGRLRLDDREHVIFAGTEQRARASYAEVALTIDNQDGAFPLDLTEIEISRRLYRSGESDVRLAGRSLPLREVQALLAQAGFGAGSYAVIGQGTIDSLLLSSPAERKLLFDEAAGIRGPELGRETALRKLTATETNLTRLRDLEAELSPRLASLERLTAGGRGHEELAERVKQLQQQIAATEFREAQAAVEQLSAELQTTTAATRTLEHDQREAEQALARLQREAEQQATQRRRLQDTLDGLEQTRDAAAAAMADHRAALTLAEQASERVKVVKQQVTAAEADLAQAHEREAELEAELATTKAAATRAQKAVGRAIDEVSQVQANLVALRQDTDDGTRDQYVDHALQVIKTLASSLGSEQTSRDHIRLLVHKAGRLLSHASRSTTAHLVEAVQAAQEQLENAMSKRETAIEHQTNITITLRSLEIDAAHHRELIARLVAGVQTRQAELAPAETTAARHDQLRQAVRQAKAALDTATAQLERRRQELRALEADPATSHAATQAATALERVAIAAQASRDRRASLTAELAEAKQALAAARRQTSPDAALPPPSKSLAELRAALVQAQAQLEARTTAQAEQLAEYEALTTRLTDLRTQIADLEAAATDLRQVVSELASLIQARFKDNFQALAHQFSAYFGRLFDGGSAALKLEETDDGTYGISITASPKGKRLVSLAALSGGERSLAGVALLAAILHVNPSPFVVLDEIDAALDETNSGRLATILAELQAQSQLIVITHNRQTMQAARVLYGITSTPQQASKLLSLRLEEATQLAAR